MSQTEATALKLPIDVPMIQQLLPHRYPFLLVDRVVEFEAHQRVLGIKNVTINEPFFQGHFPGLPVMPGVLVIEALAQAGAVMAMRASKFDPASQVIYFMAIDKVKFRKPVVPGDQLRLEVKPLRKGAAIWKMEGRALVDGQVVAEAEFLASMQKRA